MSAELLALEVREGKMLLHELPECVGAIPAPVLDLLARLLDDGENASGQVLRFLRATVNGTGAVVRTCRRCGWEDLSHEFRADGTCSDSESCARSTLSTELRAEYDRLKGSIPAKGSPTGAAWLSGFAAALLVVDRGE